MENIFVYSKSEQTLSGIFFKIFTYLNNSYTFTIRAILKKGDNAFIYCEDKRQTKFVSRRNVFLKGIEKEYKFEIKGINSFINFGVLFTNKDIEYELEIIYIGVINNTIILNNMDNLILYRNANIKYNIDGLKKNQNKKEDKNLKDLVYNNKIKQFYTSSIVNHFEGIKQIYNLKGLENKNEPLLTIGIYNNNDIDIINQHVGTIYIIWQNKNTKIRDLENLINKIKNKNIKHYVNTEKSQEQLKKFNIDCNKIEFNLNQILNINPSNKIFIYNGTTKGQEDFYGKSMYEKLKQNLPEYDFILSNDLSMSYDRYSEVYINCIAAIVLCDNYNNNNDINLVYSLNSLDILTITHNTIESNTKWNSIIDIELLIRYRNIYIFNRYIKKYKRILFICTDYPGWGGAATNTYELIKWYNNNTRHKTFGLFLHDKEVIMSEEDIYIYNIKSNENYKYAVQKVNKYFDNEPDLIILRNFVDSKLLKYFSCPKYFLIPGIFKQNLNKYCGNLSNNEIKIYVNKPVLDSINKCDKSFTNSYETKNLLKKIYNIDTEILHFNYIPYYASFTNFQDNIWNKRRFDIAVIISDFERKIKNIALINKIFDLVPDLKKVVIGKNNNKIIGKNIVRHNLLDHDTVLKMYSNIKYVINTSYYEACSNVLVEAKYNGCKIMIINENNYMDMIKLINDTLNNNIFNDESKSILGESPNIIKHDELIMNVEPMSVKKIESGDSSTDSEEVITNKDNKFMSWVEKNLDSEENMDSKVRCIEFNPQEKNIIVNLIPNEKNDKIIMKIMTGEEITRDKKILIISTQYPFYGGAATLAYKMHEKLVELGYQSYCMFLHNNNRCNYNPYNIKNVYISNLENDFKNKESCQKYYKDYLKICNNPEIVIGINYISPIIGKNLYPQSKVYYYITGNRYISKYNLSAQEYLNSEERNLDEIDDDELYCMNISDYIIPNSDLTLNIFMKMYPEFEIKYTKIIEFESLFSSGSTTKQENNSMHDITVVSSRFNRNVKNIELINKIYSNERTKKYNKACIGENSKDNIQDATTHYGLKSHTETIEILRKSKILLITSKYESCSVTLLDGMNSDCIIISNINVAASKYIDDNFVIDSDDPTIWIEKINNILSNYEYYKQIFKYIKPNICLDNTMKYLINYKMNIKRKNVVFVSVDKPYKGGCSTNTYNMLKSLQNCEEINPFGIFISAEDYGPDVNPINLKNIYYAKYDTEIKNNLEKVINKIENICGKIDLYFIKNYKAYICIYWLNKDNRTKILFSPSGIRSVININHNKCKNNKYDETKFDMNMNLHDFIKNYDNELEKLIFSHCECIIPNSSLTYKIIKNTFDVGFNLKHPCNITYVDYVEDNQIHVKKYDVAFICYSWKRKIKNYEIVKKMIESKRMQKYKILVIGREQNKLNLNNLSQIDNCSNQDILKYLSAVKLLCIPSLFDSSPNILKEGLMCGCNILLSRNVGSYEHFNNCNIIDKIDDLNEWITKIEQNVNKKLQLNNFYPQLVKNQLKYNILSFSLNNSILCANMIKQSGVGIYKLPATWNNIIIKDTDIHNIKNDEKMNIYDTIKNDIYFRLFLKNDTENCKYYHYITINTNSKINRYTQPYKIYPYLSKNIYIWEISDQNLLSKFKNAKYYFLRGNYYDIYSQFINNKSKICLYPATSLIYNNNNELVVNRVIEYKFDYILYDDILNKDKWQYMFPNSKIIKFNKPVSANVINYNKERKIDYIYVATENQITKNRQLFIDYVLYCEKQKINVNIVNVGNLDQYSSKLAKLQYVNLISYDKTTYNNIVELFNISKINLIFSGRDAVPRVVTESLACGCYNIALDTISDGKYLYNNICGLILSFPNIKKIYDKTSKSISYISNDQIFREIIKYKDDKFDHQKISAQFLNSLSYDLYIN